MSKALLKLQIGPVQDFIAQARSTRDLWSGSYLLSWLSGHVIYQLRKVDPAAEVVFPRLDGKLSPMLQWIRSADYRIGEQGKDATLPTVPNQMLATVSSDIGESEIRGLADSVFGWDSTDPETKKPSEWRRICDRCRVFLETEEKEVERVVQRTSSAKFTTLLWKYWDQQLREFWQVNWLLWPAPDETADEQTLNQLFAQTPIGRLWHDVPPQSQPSDWMMRYQAASHRFDARRQTRDFRAWHGVPGLHKDSLSGKEEALAAEDWLVQIPRGKQGKGVALNHLFRNNDPLGAPNLVKRVWHKAYL